MLKFVSGLTTGIVLGGVGLFALELIALVALEDSPETREAFFEHLNK